MLSAARGNAQAQQVDLNMPPLDIYGPPGIRDYIRSSLRLTYSHIANNKNIHIHELATPMWTERSTLTRPTATEHTILSDKDDIFRICKSRDDTFEVYGAPIKHTVPCIGYVVKEKSRPGTFVRVLCLRTTSKC
jgi:ribonuclease Z